ncbi:MAG: hypothetical protein HN553_00470, partial [Opitutae bacterium]|nr:hypothetical protein [Opitutae bacterium]
KLNGVDFDSTFFSPEKDRTVVSWVLSTSYTFGAAGLGYVGAPGSYVMAPMSPGVTVHELGHNFGLWHANRHEGEGIRPNSDDRTVIDYGNPYSVMGTGGASGDFTISSKVFLNEVGSFGYAGGNIKNPSEFNSKKVDVADLSSAEEVSASLLKENGAVNSNTFRIYRHDYGFAPYSLSNAEFELEIPNSALPSKFSEYLLDQNFSLLIGGPGEGGSGHIAKGGIFGHKLVITEGGKGYSEEPTIDVLNDSNENLLRISPTWIKRKAGTEHYEIDSIRNLSPVGLRGLRGVEIPASQYSPLGFDAETVMGSYWVSYRRKISEFGLSVINATKRSPDGSENIFLDMTPHTQGIVNESTNPGTDFDDAFLMLGSTFSDYESDSHITPIRKGGIPPMDYIEAVVNIGTVGSGIAKAPKFKLEVSNSSPFINEPVNFTVRPADGNYSNYAYSWLINEVGFSEFGYLNRSAISQKFSSIGYQVVKVLVSDMKGGISSRNITVNVGGAEKSKYSIASGQVNSSKGPIQGAKVVFKKAEIIEHSVGVSGNIQDSRLNTTHGNPQHFVIDNERDKQLIMHRGEIHRFTFESSSNNLPLSFFESPEHESANVRLNLLFSPSVETAGGGYTKTPLIDLNETSRFDSTYSQKITTLDLFQNELSGLLSWDDFQFGTLITKPTAKSLLADTVVSRIIVRPIKVDSITGLPIHFGGRGM